MKTGKIEEIERAIKNQEALLMAEKASLEALKGELEAKKHSILGHEGDLTKLDQDLYVAQVSAFLQESRARLMAASSAVGRTAMTGAKMEYEAAGLDMSAETSSQRDGEFTLDSNDPSAMAAIAEAAMTAIAGRRPPVQGDSNNLCSGESALPAMGEPPSMVRVEGEPQEKKGAIANRLFGGPRVVPKQIEKAKSEGVV